MNLRSVVIFCLSIVHPFLCYEKMDMSDDPILQFLKMDPDSVIEHELVDVSFPEHLHKRETRLYQDEKLVRIRAFGNDINLWLHPRDIMMATPLTEVYAAFYVPDKRSNMVEFEKLPDAMADVGRLFEANHTYLASLVIGTDDFSRWTMNGFLQLRGDNRRLVVRSLPEDVVHRYMRKRRSIDGSNDRSSNMSYHVALKLNDDPSNENPPQYIEKVRAPMSFDQVPVDWNDSTDTLYPEILVYVDSTFLDDWLNNLTPFLEYLLAFWNGVDLMFRSLENPKVRLHISKIVLGVDPESTYYILYNKFQSPGKALKGFNVYSALENATFFFYSVYYDDHMDFDIAVTMTKLPMGPDPNFLFVRGEANKAAACEQNHALKSKSGVAIIVADHGFEDILTATHEIGHLLGMKHDNTTFPDNCLPKNGLIMQPTNEYTTENATLFSECSLNDFQTAINASLLKCLYNPPQATIYGGEFLKLMPGRMSSLDDQCYDLNEGPPCVPEGLESVDICVEMYCTQHFYNHSAECRRTTHGAAPGTPCGNPKIDPKPRFCLQNRCVSL